MGKNLSVICINRTPAVLGFKKLLPAVVAVVYHFLSVSHGIMAGITHHAKKQYCENACDKTNLSTCLLLDIQLLLFLPKFLFFQGIFSFSF